jgi:hypothetical protein
MAFEIGDWPGMAFCAPKLCSEKPEWERHGHGMMGGIKDSSTCPRHRPRLYSCSAGAAVVYSYLPIFSFLILGGGQHAKAESCWPLTCSNVASFAESRERIGVVWSLGPARQRCITLTDASKSGCTAGLLVAYHDHEPLQVRKAPAPGISSVAHAISP